MLNKPLIKSLVFFFKLFLKQASFAHQDSEEKNTKKSKNTVKTVIFVILLQFDFYI